MTKTEFVQEVSARAQVSQADVQKVPDAFIEVTTETLAKGEEVNLPSFGKFKPVIRPARKARNLYTGEIMEVPAGKSVQFRLSTILKRSLVAER